MKIAFFPALLLALVPLLGRPAHAQDVDGAEANKGSFDVYNFGSGCTTLGPWTQKALEGSRSIISTLEKLRTNPLCSGIKERIAQTVAEVSKVESTLDATGAGDPDVSEDEARDSQALMLESVAVDPADAGQFDVRDLARRMVDTQAGNATSMQRRGIKEAAKRIRQLDSDDTGRILNSFDSVIAALPELDGCMIGADRDAANLLNSIVNTASAFAASPEMTLARPKQKQRISNTVNNLLNTLRELQFTRAEFRLNQEQFRASLGCLLESTTQNYCMAKDAQVVLEWLRKKRLENKDKGKTAFEDSPLEGYRVLTRNVPAISHWILEAMFGVPPQFIRDSQFRIETFDTFVNQQEAIWTLQGTIAEKLFYFRANPTLTLEAKQAVVLDMLSAIVKEMTGKWAQSENFFLMTMPEQMLPFFLISGERKIPDVVLGNQPGLMKMSWHDYMVGRGAGGGYIDAFKDPEGLIAKIQKNLDTLNEWAIEQANVYVTARLILDLPLATIKSMIGNRTDVMEYLEGTKAYIGKLMALIKAAPPETRKLVNPDVLGVMADTRGKIQRVLDSIHALDQYNTDANLARIETDVKYADEVREAYKKVLKVVFDEFNVLIQRDTFLSARIGQFVKADFALRVRNRADMTPLVQEILIASGEDLETRLTEFFERDPNGVILDLSNAQKVNRTNIQAIEYTFSEAMVPMIDELKRIAANERPTDWSLYWSAMKRLELDSFRDATDNGEAYQGFYNTDFGRLWSYISAIVGIRQAARSFATPDRYPVGFSQMFRALVSNGPPRGGADPLGSDQVNFARWCIQTLAFEGRGKFVPLCTNAVLKSYFRGRDRWESSFLNARYNKYMGTCHDGVAADGTRVNVCSPDPAVWKKPVSPDDYCAFRDFNRRNMIYWLTQDVYGTD